MAILTLAEFKLLPTYLLNTALFSDDTINQALLDTAEERYLDIRGKGFKKITGDVTDTEYNIAGVSSLDIQGIVKGMLASGTNIRGKVTKVFVSSNYITLDTAATATGSDEEFDIYPFGSQGVIADIVYFLRVSATADPNKKSESIEKHSWTYRDTSDLVGGIPKSIANRIKSYVNTSITPIRGEGYDKGREEISTKDYDPQYTELDTGSVQVTQ